MTQILSLAIHPAHLRQPQDLRAGRSRGWRLLWPFNLWWRRLEPTPLEAELAVEAGVFTAKPACFPLYPEEKDGKIKHSRQGSVWILTFPCNLCHCGKSLNLSSLQCPLLKAEINIQQILTKHLFWTSTHCFWFLVQGDCSRPSPLDPSLGSAPRRAVEGRAGPLSAGYGQHQMKWYM